MNGKVQARGFGFSALLFLALALLHAVNFLTFFHLVLAVLALFFYLHRELFLALVTFVAFWHPAQV